MRRYTANVGIIPAIMNNGDLILSDELNHASIIDGCRLSHAEVKIYPHKDVASIEKALREAKHPGKLIVTDGIFSMDGDIAPLPEIVELAREYDALVMVDINMGTLSKALASMGGYVAGSFELVDYLRNKARIDGLIFRRILKKCSNRSRYCRFEHSY